MNALFDKAREAFLTGKIDWLGDTIRAALCRGEKPDTKTAAHLADITTAAVSEPLTGKTAAGGVAAAASILFRDCTADAVSYLVIYQDTKDAGTSRLIACIDTLGHGVFPISGNGGDVQIMWDRGVNRIFRI